MKRWIVLGVLVLVILTLVLRERNTNYAGQLNDTAPLICPNGYTQDSTTSWKCKRNVPDPTDPGGNSIPATCPSGMVVFFQGSTPVCMKQSVAEEAQRAREAQSTAGATGSGITSEQGGNADAVRRPTGMSQMTSVPSSVVTTATDVPVSSVSGTTTGGTSANLMGPTSGSSRSGSGKKIWGPPFSGAGEDTGGKSGDSTTSTVYPDLLGGLMGKSSTRMDGVGITSPSQPGLGSVLPSDASLGTDANARFFPSSRQPGDMDLIPDPYRLAKNFSTSSYSSKPDPVPFLADFSAFYK